MTWITGNHNGGALSLLNTIEKFLTTNKDMVANGDAWRVLAECSSGLVHPTNAKFTVEKGLYFQGPLNGTAPYLFISAVVSKTSGIEALAITTMLGFDKKLKDAWWAQPGATYDYAPICIPRTPGRYEIMANSRRMYGYVTDNVERMFPFYAGWLIPYTDVQNQNYQQPTVCMGSDSYLASCSPASTRGTSVGMCNVSGEYEYDPNEDKDNKGAFLILPSGEFGRILANGKNGVRSVISNYSGAVPPSSIYHVKKYSPVTVNGVATLYPEAFIVNTGSGEVILGELDGVASVGQAGATASSVVTDNKGVEWVLVKQRNPGGGVDGYAFKRA